MKHLTVRILLLIVPFFLFSSCATLIYKNDYDIKVSTDVPNAKAEVLNIIYNLPAEFKIERSKQDLEIKLIGDSIEKYYLVKASLNGAFLPGNFLWMYFSPVGFIIDFTNQKRFYYGDRIFLDSTDSLGIIRPNIPKSYYDYWDKSFSTHKGQLNIAFSLPWVNSFYLHPVQETPKANTGFWGISAGLEYFYKDNKYLSLTGSAVMDFFIPIPAAVDLRGEWDHMHSVYTSVTDNYKFRRFTVGYGLNFSSNTWRFVYHGGSSPPTREPASKSSNSLGITLDGYHQIGKRFHVGLIYRPTLLNIYPDIDLNYEHLISLDFKWKFRLKK